MPPVPFVRYKYDTLPAHLRPERGLLGLRAGLEARRRPARPTFARAPGAPQHAVPPSARSADARRMRRIRIGEGGGGCSLWHAVPCPFSEPSPPVISTIRLLCYPPPQAFANLRPATILPQLIDASSLKREIVEGTDIMARRRRSRRLRPPPCALFPPYCWRPAAATPLRGSASRQALPSAPQSAVAGVANGFRTSVRLRLPQVVRELTGGIYFGQPKGFGTNDKGDRTGFNTDVYSVPEVQRIAKVGFEAARKRKGKLCSVDKANVLEVSQLWREVVIEMHKDYQDVELSHMCAYFSVFRHQRASAAARAPTCARASLRAGLPACLGALCQVHGRACVQFPPAFARACGRAAPEPPNCASLPCVPPHRCATRSTATPRRRYVDNAAMQLVRAPTQFDTIVTSALPSSFHSPAGHRQPCPSTTTLFQSRLRVLPLTAACPRGHAQHWLTAPLRQRSTRRAPR